MKAESIKINHIKEPLGIGCGKVYVSWVPCGDKKQTAYRLVFKAENSVLYDSGKVLSDKTFVSPNVEVPSKCHVSCFVSLWNESDAEGEVCGSFFETGLSREDWQASWIDPEPTDRVVYKNYSEPQNIASYLRKCFNVKKKSSARMYITAHGIYDAYINGVHVDGFVFAPGCDEYSARLPVQTYDISDLVKDGENELIVSLGDGWWRGCLGWGLGRNRFGSDVALLCQIECDGETVLVSDETWESSQDGPLCENDMMRIEKYDARKEVSNWHGVTVRDFGYKNLCVSEHLPVREHERFKAKLIITPNGEKLLDFGQNFAGYVELDIEAEDGDKIVLWHTEALGSDGNFQNFNYQNPDMPFCDQKLEYICKKGRNIYHQTKCYYGFRYAKIETELDITGDEFTGVAVYSDMEQTGYFSCGNDDVNQLFRNTVWSMKSNFVDIPTDCPHREKEGFSGDCQVFSGTAMYLMDCYPVLARWLRMQSSSQFEDGCVLQRVPAGVTGQYDGCNGAAGWCDSFEVLPYNIMKLYGVNELISELYPAVKKWMKFCIERAKPYRPENADMPEEYRDYFVDTAHHWGEWCEPGRTPADYFKESDETGHAEFATAYLSYGCRIMGEIAAKLGFGEDSIFFFDASEKAKNAYRYAYLKNGRVDSDRQCHYVRPVFMGLLDEKEKIQTIQDLVGLIKAQGGKIGTGFLTTCELCNVLTDNGHADAAFDLLLNTESPSWLYGVKKGATTVWESWFGMEDGKEPLGSLNHYSFGAVSGWLMSRVLGIKVLEGAAVIKPYTDKRLGHAEGCYFSPYGKISSSWKYEGETIRFEFEIPSNMSAKIILPNGEEHSVSTGKYEFVI